MVGVRDDSRSGAGRMLEVCAVGLPSVVAAAKNSSESFEHNGALWVNSMGLTGSGAEEYKMLEMVVKEYKDLKKVKQRGEGNTSATKKRLKELKSQVVSLKKAAKAASSGAAIAFTTLKGDGGSNGAVWDGASATNSGGRCRNVRHTFSPLEERTHPWPVGTKVTIIDDGSDVFQKFDKATVTAPQRGASVLLAGP